MLLLLIIKLNTNIILMSSLTLSVGIKTLNVRTLRPAGKLEELTRALDKYLWNTPGPEVIKLFSCSTQLSMKFSPLIDVKMPTIVGILTYMSGKNNILGLTEP